MARIVRHLTLFEAHLRGAAYNLVQKKLVYTLLRDWRLANLWAAYKTVRIFLFHTVRDGVGARLYAISSFLKCVFTE